MSAQPTDPKDPIARWMQREEGVHRRIRPQARDARARMELVPRGIGSGGDAPQPHAFRKRDPIFGLPFHWRTRLSIPERGSILDLAAETREVLREIMQDYAEYTLRLAPQTGRTARRYGEHGVGARDPGSGAVVPRLKDVLQGNLQKFYDAEIVG